MWQQAVEEAKESLDRRFGRTPTTRHNPPPQLSVRRGDLPAATSEVLFGKQQHPRAQTLILALAKVATMPDERGSRPGKDKPMPLLLAAASQGEQQVNVGAQQLPFAESGGFNGGRGGAGKQSAVPTCAMDPTPPARPSTCVPAWPELLHEAGATPADVRAVEGADALGWLRALARGWLPVRGIFRVLVELWVYFMCILCLPLCLNLCLGFIVLASAGPTLATAACNCQSCWTSIGGLRATQQHQLAMQWQEQPTGQPKIPGSLLNQHHSPRAQCLPLQCAWGCLSSHAHGARAAVPLWQPCTARSPRPRPSHPLGLALAAKQWHGRPAPQDAQRPP